MFDKIKFKSHSGLNLQWKINCDSLTDNDLNTLAYIVSEKYTFYDVIGIPTGGNRLSKALLKYADKRTNTLLLVDDVLTTGNSMEEFRKELSLKHGHIQGVVIFSRTKEQFDWIDPIFKLNL